MDLFLNGCRRPVHVDVRDKRLRRSGRQLMLRRADIYIHTDHDTLQQIDATKLRRVALLGARRVMFMPPWMPSDHAPCFPSIPPV